MVSKGYSFKVRFGPNQKYTKFILEFELWDPSMETLYNTTKFQALKYLSKEQLEMMEIYENVSGFLKQAGTNFGRYIERLKELENLCLNDERYLKMKDAIKGMKGLRV